ncbi:MAG TPA: asparagine synthase (glutamine-hydrolyzing) [bacterium]|nr:asparagine synthase (glutamine-hydrolyzing) [bacterium]
MCGIVGCIPSPEKDVLKASLSNIAHRGPDGEGVWMSPDNDVSLGHRRLSIIDTTDAAVQPMFYIDRFVITFNGEIYNFIELRKELESLGHKFRTQSDTEVVLAAYCEWKEGCLLKFNGMWAFAIWDKEEKRLFMSRDRFGVKPLFYSIDNKRFVFGSEMKALFPFLDHIEASEHFDWCSKHIFEYESTEKCLIKGIKRFPAGHYGYYLPDEKRLELTKYWNTLDHLVEVPQKYEDQVEMFRELFVDAVKLRMRSDVRIGTTLSGGLDSSAVVSTMALINTGEERVSKDWQHAFVACFEGTFLDERKYAQKVVEHIKIPATFIEIKPPEFEELYKMLYQFEELYITSPVPMMAIYKELRKNNVVVSIDGHGADELLSGYGNDLNYALLDAGFNLSAIRNIQEAYASRFVDSIQIDKKSRGVYRYIRDLRSVSGGKRDFLRFVLNGGKIRKNDSRYKSGAFNSVLYDIFHKTVLPTLLRNYDRYSMASGVEVRMPFMDYRIVTFLFSLPWTSKIKNGFTKAIVRDAIGPFMPEEIAWRKNKIGFNTPIVDWIKNEWREPLSKIVNNNEKLNDSFMRILYYKDAKYLDGEQFWKDISPFLWNKSLMENKRGVW